MPIDTETGYDDTLVCECIPCRFCKGEGVRDYYWTKDQHGRDVELANSVAIECSECHGTGKDSDDCGVHDEPFIVEPSPNTMQQAMIDRACGGVK